MGLFWGNDETEQEEDGEIERMTLEMRVKLGNLECEEAIMKDKDRFGRVRTSLMQYLREKHDKKLANRALSRVNKRIQEHYLNS